MFSFPKHKDYIKTKLVQDMNSTDLLSIAEASKRLGVTRQRLHKLIEHGQVQAVRLGRYLYIEVSEVERYEQLPEERPYVPRSTQDKNSVDRRQ